MLDKQRTLGQFETPADVADLLLGFCLRRPGDRVLDPSCGQGALLQRAALWQQWAGGDRQDSPPHTLWGVELDTAAAAAARELLPQATIQTQNFFTMAPGEPFDAIVGNPPYTRASWIARLQEAATQMTFTWASPLPQENPQSIVPQALWTRLSHRAGLHAYFFLHGLPFLREGGRFGFVVPNGWLDVAYGTDLKQFLLDHFRIVAIVESAVERWFVHAKVNTCLVILETCSEPDRRAQNLVRLVRLRRSLTELIATPPADPRRPQTIKEIVSRLLPARSRHDHETDIQVLAQADLAAESRWGLRLRAPDVYIRRREDPDLPPLQRWAQVQRGYTTGANEFFYLNEAAINKWGIEAQFRQPVLKSLRGLDALRLGPADCRHELLLIPPGTNLTGTAVSAYITWGESQGFHLRQTCSNRAVWYTLPPQEQTRLVLPKGIWRRHSAPLLDEPLLVDQQLYQIRVPAAVSPSLAAALLNSAWFMLQCELNGRVNFGAGVLWLATYELAAMRLPDPRTLNRAQTAALIDHFSTLAQRPCADIETELARADRQALDAAVFDLMGFTPMERTAVLGSLRDRVRTRRQRAQVGNTKDVSED